MTDRSKFGPTAGSGFEPAPVTGPFSGPPGAARALALALGCPDLFLIDSPAGPDRDGFAAALAATAARLGRTVLVVAPDGPAADALLSHLSADRDPAAARAVGPDESADSLTDAVRARTTNAIRVRAEQHAAQARSRRADGLSSDLDAKRSAIHRQIATAKEQLATLTPMLAAKESGRIWSGLFWKATFTGNVANKVTAIEKRIAEWDTEARGLDEQAVTARVEPHVVDAVPACPIVVAPYAAVGRDPATHGPFDHVILTAAERATPEFMEALRRLSPRCVLVGSRFGRQAGPLFAELYAERDTGPWVAETGRLVYRVVSVPANRRNELKGEPLADRPEIELRFLSFGGGDVELVEVAFPETLTPAEARTWLAAELGVTRLSPCGQYHWHDGPGPIRACWHLADTVPEPHKAWADFGNGVKLLVAGIGADAVTAAVTFDPDRWDRPAAEAWLKESLAEVPPRAVRLPKVAVSQPATPKPVPVAIG